MEGENAEGAGGGVDFGEDHLYFGSRPVLLVPVSGDVLPFDEGDWETDFSPQSLKSCLERAQPLPLPRDAPSSLKSCLERAQPLPLPRDAPSRGLELVLVPAIPARDLRRRSGGPGNGTGSSKSLPPQLSRPLLKVPAGGVERKQEEPGALEGFASGVRSALVKVEGRWFRLKGCGNDEEGMVVRVSAERGGNSKEEGKKCVGEVRGSAFVHTGLRELYMTAKVGSHIEHPHPYADGEGDKGEVARIVSCNQSLGLFLYGKGHSPFGLEFPFRTACIVEETRGDRRLGTHLLAGFSLLLPSLISFKDGDLTAQAKAVSALFPKKRPDGCEVTTAQLMSDWMICSELGEPGWGLEWSDVPRDETTLCFLSLFGGAEEMGFGFVSPEELENLPFPSQWTQEGRQEMRSEWRSLWRRECTGAAALLREIEEEETAEGKDRGAVFVPAYLFSRLGFECGAFLRELHRLRASWGTYQDALCHASQWHCNAHSNNMVVLPPQEEQGGQTPEEESLRPFLCFLDLDMAFDEDTFVDFASSTSSPSFPEHQQKQGERSLGGVGKEEFDRLLFREHLNFLEVLAGADASSGVPQVALREVDGRCAALQGVQSALLDTLALSYLRGYTGEDRFPSSPVKPGRIHRFAHSLVRLCLVVMAECVA